MTTQPHISGLILAGGRGRRMGGTAKALQPMLGRPLISWVVERLRPQVAEVIVSANRDLERYAAIGDRIVTDRSMDLSGPLAGLQAGLAVANHDLMVTVPCDAPLLPPDLVARLAFALEAAQADVAVASTGDQPQPVFCLCKREMLSSIDAFLASGGRKVEIWLNSVAHVQVRFDDEAEAFINVNTAEELRALERKLGGNAPSA
jgi:molybdopterin-guanine dinucleotide biosynthesis protein A